MATASARQHAAATLVRPARLDDLAALMDIEQRTFVTDRIARRGFRRLLSSETATLLVAEGDGHVMGYALLLYRAGSAVARLYSIAVHPDFAGRGAGPQLLIAAEEAARTRGCMTMRLEVHEGNAGAISRYHKSGYRLFGRYDRYYQDHGDALRYEKRLVNHQPERHCP